MLTETAIKEFKNVHLVPLDMVMQRYSGGDEEGRREVAEEREISSWGREIRRLQTPLIVKMMRSSRLLESQILNTKFNVDPLFGARGHHAVQIPVRCRPSQLSHPACCFPC